MERVKLDKKGRLTIPVRYREKLALGEEVALILEEDHLIVCKTATAEEFKGARGGWPRRSPKKEISQ